MSIADHRYVSFTTYRRNGDAVSSAVWIAPLSDGRAAFTTDPTSGKVKRLRNNASVTLVPCDVRGKVEPGTSAVTGTATIVAPDAEGFGEVDRAMKAKYGIQFRLIELGGRIKGLFGRHRLACGIVIDLTAAA